MCDALTGAGLALTGGSMLAKMQGESETRGARSRVGGAETRRQQGFEQQSNNLFKDSLANVARERQEAETATAENKRATESVANIEAAPDPTNPSDVVESADSSVVKGSNARQLIKALNLGKQRAVNSAKVNAYGDANMNTGITLGRNGMKQGQIGTAAQRSSALLPGEYEEANHAGDGWGALGDALGVAGTVAGAAGAFGAGPGWGELFGSTPVVGSAPAGGFSSIDDALGTVRPRGFFPRVFSGTFSPTAANV